MSIISVDMNVVKHCLRSKMYLRCNRGSKFISNCVASSQ